jgi:nucleosome binding factor SPN SPT16 subunit
MQRKDIEKAVGQIRGLRYNQRSLPVPARIDRVEMSTPRRFSDVSRALVHVTIYPGDPDRERQTTARTGQIVDITAEEIEAMRAEAARRRQEEAEANARRARERQLRKERMERLGVQFVDGWNGLKPTDEGIDQLLDWAEQLSAARNNA